MGQVATHHRGLAAASAKVMSGEVGQSFGSTQRKLVRSEKVAIGVLEQTSTQSESWASA